MIIYIAGFIVTLLLACFLCGTKYIDFDDSTQGPATCIGVIVWPITLAALIVYLPCRGIYELGKSLKKEIK